MTTARAVFDDESGRPDPSATVERTIALRVPASEYGAVSGDTAEAAIAMAKKTLVHLAVRPPLSPAAAITAALHSEEWYDAQRERTIRSSRAEDADLGWRVASADVHSPDGSASAESSAGALRVLVVAALEAEHRKLLGDATRARIVPAYPRSSVSDLTHTTAAAFRRNGSSGAQKVQ